MTTDEIGFMPPIEQIPFPIPRQLREDLENLIEAWNTNDPYLCDYQDEVRGSARMVSVEHDEWIRAHYVTGKGVMA